MKREIRLYTGKPNNENTAGYAVLGVVLAALLLQGRSELATSIVVEITPYDTLTREEIFAVCAKLGVTLIDG
jgi:hypothetical protein